MMCVSAGKSVGEIVWRKCEGIGSSGHVVGWLERRSFDMSASVIGREGEEGSFRSGCGWFEFLCVCVKLINGC